MRARSKVPNVGQRPDNELRLVIGMPEQLGLRGDVVAHGDLLLAFPR
jgi:hypothetical protein